MFAINFHKFRSQLSIAVKQSRQRRKSSTKLSENPHGRGSSQPLNRKPVQARKVRSNLLPSAQNNRPWPAPRRAADCAEQSRWPKLRHRRRPKRKRIDDMPRTRGFSRCQINVLLPLRWSVPPPI